MASGVPVIGSAVGGLLDSVADGVTGVLVPPRRPRSIARAARWILDDPTRRVAMGRAAVERVHARFTWPAVGRATCEVYEELHHGRTLLAPPAAAGGVPA